MTWKNRLTAYALTVAFAAGSSSCALGSSNDSVKVKYDGEEVEFDVGARIINDRTMVPMRKIFETFGAKVVWDSTAQTITARKKDKTITLTLGSENITISEGKTDENGNEITETVTVDTAPQIVDDRTLVPLRAISELLKLDVSFDEKNLEVDITTPEDGDSDEWANNTGEIDLNAMISEADGVKISDNIVKITKGGDFTISGTLKDGYIHIDTKDKVKLSLDGASITNTSGPAIFIENADKAYISAKRGSENYLEDGSEYSDSELDGCIHAKDDLEIQGNGSLTIKGNYKHGIKAGDSLEIQNCTLTIDAVKDGINVNETLTAKSGTINVTAVEDGISSDSITDLQGADITVKTTYPQPEETQNEFWGRENTSTNEQTTEDSVSSKGIKADWYLEVSGGNINVNSTDTALHSSGELVINNGEIELYSESDKGIQAHGDLTINDGKINITKSTEGIEGKKILTFNGGDINVVASDDGINAGGNGTGMMGGFGNNMQRPGRGGRGGMGGGMPEGMTPPEMSENGEMPAPPDMAQNGETPTPPEMGQNGEMPAPPKMNNSEAHDGTQTQNNMQRPGRGMGGGMPGGMGGSDSSAKDSTHHIQFNGGTITINANNDGIDSNGSIFFEGSTVTVFGPENNGNSALDYQTAMVINSGEVIAAGSAGMAVSPSSASKQNTLSVYLSETAASGTAFEVKTSSGKTVAKITPQKQYSHVMVSTPDLTTGEEYNIYVNGELIYTVTIESTITTAGERTGGMRMGGMRSGDNPGRTANTDINTAQ